MKWTIARRLSAGFATVILLFVLIGLLSQRREALLQEYFGEVLATDEIQTDLQLFKGYLIDMETGLRGYLLAGNPDFLEPYHRASQEKGAVRQRLGHMFKGDSLNGALLLEIDEVIARWVATFSEPLIEAQRLKMEGLPSNVDLLVDSLVIPGHGREMMNHVRAKFDQIVANQQAALEVQLAQVEATRWWNDRFILILAVVVVLMAILIVYFVNESIQRRVRSMTALAGAISQGRYGEHISEQYDDELTTVVNALNTMSVRLKTTVEELKAKNRELDQFAYVTSHDLKAPLRAINNLAEWIAEDMGDDISPDTAEKIRMLRGRVHRMENQIQGILAYSRIGRAAVRPEPVDLEALLHEIQDTIVDGKADFKLDIHVPALFTERLALDQVLCNLVSNGIKYNDKERPSIAVSAREDGDQIRVAVTDNGPGIEPRYHEKIFQIFQTLQARDTIESTGIGLSIVKKLVESKGGHITLRSELGLGSTFEFTWPVHEEPESKAAPTAEQS